MTKSNDVQVDAGTSVCCHAVSRRAALVCAASLLIPVRGTKDHTVKTITVMPTQGRWKGRHFQAIVNRDAIFLIEDHRLVWEFRLNCLNHLMVENQRRTYITGKWPKSLHVV
jgi:predicted hydrolase (HD superfamily)